MARTLSPGGRPAYYDRNPKTLLQFKVGDEAPHSGTDEFTYTVPTGRKALITGIELQVMRKTAATTAAEARAMIYSDSGDYTNAVTYVAQILTNNVGDKDEIIISAPILLGPGQLIKGSSDDGSTGGTCKYVLTMRGVEFDA
jgi:hypothetical protein